MGKQQAEDVEAGDLFRAPTPPPQLTRSASLAIDSPAHGCIPVAAIAVRSVAETSPFVFPHVAKLQAIV
jgi:hypothetical protein